MSSATVSGVVGLDDAPEEILALAGMDADYVDVFTIEIPGAGGRSPEDWARTVLERTRVGRNAPKLWRALGLRLGPRPSPDHVQGWKIADGGADWLRVETASWYATGHAVVRVEDARLSVALFVRFDRPVARLIWPPVSALHRRGMPVLLRQARKAAR